MGGASRRMGRPKGLLRAPGSEETLVERLVRLGREAQVEPVLVGDAAPYRALDLPEIADDPAGIGPMGGLRALLQRYPVALAVACDMPMVGLPLLERLRDSTGVVVPKGEYWEPLCARYEAAVVLPAIDEALAADEHSLQRLIARAPATALRVRGDQLVDWDTPEDVSGVRPEG